MNLKKVQFACEILTEQLNHWSLFPIALVVMGSTINLTAIFSPNVFLWVLCSLFPFACFMIRSKVEQVFPFVMWHLALILVSILIPASTAPYRIIYVGAAVYYAITSLLLRYKRNKLYSNPIQLPVALAISFLAGCFQFDLVMHKWRIYFYLPFVLVVALFFVVFYIHRYLDFLNVNKRL